VPLGADDAVVVTFDGPVMAVAATKAQYYSIAPGVRVLKAVLHNDGGPSR
jgi:hypothetical protein